MIRIDDGETSQQRSYQVGEVYKLLFHFQHQMTKGFGGAATAKRID